MVTNFHSPSKEEDEKERLSQVKELQEDDVGDNTEPLEDLFLGLSVEEVTRSVPRGELSGCYRLMSYCYSL